MSFSGMAQFWPDSNSGPCFVDVTLTNQGTAYTLVATPGGSTSPIISTYTWSIDGVIDTSLTGNTFTFTGVEGSIYDICVTIPCDSGTTSLCTDVFIDSVGVTPIDSLAEGCLTGVYLYGQSEFLSAYAGFDGIYDPNDLTWTIDGVIDTTIYGDYVYTSLPAGSYTVCATYDSDSCTATYCDSITIVSSGNPIDSLDEGCLTSIFVASQGSFISVAAYFDGADYNDNDLIWTIDGVVDTTMYGNYLYTPMVDGTYYICATYNTDSCFATFCDTVIVSSNNPIDSLNEACLNGIYVSNQGNYFSATASFDGMNYDLSALTWSINGVIDSTLFGDYVYSMLPVGSYTICATYNTDSCSATMCDSIIITSSGNPMDSLDAGCLESISSYGVGGQYFFTAEFDNPNGIIEDVIWSVDSNVMSGVNGEYLTQVFADGDYTICATYITDSCTSTVCIDITVDNSLNGNDSIIYIDSIGFGNWVVYGWDSIYVDSTLLDELENWDLDDWSDSLIDVFFGDSININTFDSNDIYVLLDGLTQDDIDSLFNMGVVGFDLDDLDGYWEDFLDDNDGLDTLGLTFSDLLNLFSNFIEAKAIEVLSIDEVSNNNIDVFYNPNTQILTINTDNIGHINVYNIQGQRVLSFNENNPQLNLSSINTGLYILSIEINGKLYSHKIVK